MAYAVHIMRFTMLKRQFVTADKKIDLNGMTLTSQYQRCTGIAFPHKVKANNITITLTTQRTGNIHGSENTPRYTYNDGVVTSENFRLTYGATMTWNITDGRVMNGFGIFEYDDRWRATSCSVKFNNVENIYE